MNNFKLIIAALGIAAGLATTAQAGDLDHGHSCRLDRRPLTFVARGFGTTRRSLLWSARPVRAGRHINHSRRLGGPRSEHR